MATTATKSLNTFNQSENMTSGRDMTPERYQFLKNRKAELERRLHEKCNQLKIVMNMLSEGPTMLGIMKDSVANITSQAAGLNGDLGINEPDVHKKKSLDDLNFGPYRKQSHNDNYNGYLERHNSLKNNSTQHSPMPLPSLKSPVQHPNRVSRHYPQPVPHLTNQHHVKLKKSHSMIDKNVLIHQSSQSNAAFFDRYRNTSDQLYRDYELLSDSQQKVVEPPPNYNSPPLPQTTFALHHRQPNSSDFLGCEQMGLGGLCAVNSENKNEKVWQSVPQGLSLDRKAMYRQNLPINENRRSSPQQPMKSTSLTNFDSILNIKTDDTISIGGETKKREKIWCETSLDNAGDGKGTRKSVHNQIIAVPAKNIYYHHQQQLHNQQQEHYQQKHTANKPARLVVDHRKLSSPVNRELSTSHGTLVNENIIMFPKYESLSHSTNFQQCFDTLLSSSNQYPSHVPASYRMTEVQKNESPVPLQPVNLTVVEQGKIIMPYKEVSKPFLMSDFYKYSTKYRQATNVQSTDSQNSGNSPFEGDVHSQNYNSPTNYSPL